MIVLFVRIVQIYHLGLRFPLISARYTVKKTFISIYV